MRKTKVLPFIKLKKPKVNVQTRYISSQVQTAVLLESSNCCFVRELIYPYQLLFIINAMKQSGCKLTNLPLKMHLLTRSNCYFVKKLNDVSFMSLFFKYRIHNFRY